MEGVHGENYISQSLNNQGRGILFVVGDFFDYLIDTIKLISKFTLNNTVFVIVVAYLECDLEINLVFKFESETTILLELSNFLTNLSNDILNVVWVIDDTVEQISFEKYHKI